MFDGLVKTIKVVEAKRTKFDNGGELMTIVGDDGKKYKINKTTSKGVPSVAWGQMQDLGMDFLGETIEIGYKEVPGKPFEDKKTGKMVEYTNRFVSFLSKADVPVRSLAAEEIKYRVQQSEQTPDEEVTLEDVPF